MKIFFLFLLFTLFPTQSEACRFIPKPMDKTPVEYVKSQLALKPKYVVRVKKISEKTLSDPYIREVTLEVLETFLGPKTKSIIAYAGNSSCDWQSHGEDILFLFPEPKSGRLMLPSMNSLPFYQNKDLLQALRQLE